MELSRPALAVTVLLTAVVVGPWLARIAVRLGTRDDAALPSPLRTGALTAVFAALLAGAGELTGLRPVTVALAWAAGAAVVLGAADLIGHRLPDRVTYPAYAVCGTALLVDAAVEGTWTALLRAGAAAVVAGGIAALGWLVSPQGLGLGDVKLLGLVGLLLGWFGWGVLMAGVFLGLLTGALVSVLLLVTRRATWHTAVPFGPPLLAGAVLALATGAIPPG
ncbi:leader peptidase (prepilin peptidase) / N-methyltransferase [Blastococcus aggregatus]|uniref:Leader peptidase (Prepilin peptidase) / N-methyltransferase n=1 Tax=Blastococcus aggregatus TaxID=38502 RepID=A0A285V935_9ACTN|nr:A24 family peptidase [Blastococcus aggregatus]SOC50580.1 leader peptidase (prepilin peptidase) / N-methyltransferase [Blastococcus aggregatus]